MGVWTALSLIDVESIGAGGGSLARVDRMGLLKVGPDSAGADPGPACYASGGQVPTVFSWQKIRRMRNPAAESTAS